MVSFDNKSYSKKLLHLISWGHWFTFFNIIAAIALSSYYLFNEATPTSLLGQAYLVTTWLSHIAFLTFVSFVLILFPLTLILPYTRFIRACASIIFTVGLLLLVLDAFIYARLGYHLNASSSSQIVEIISEQIRHNSTSFYAVSLVLALVILIFELIVSNYAWKHLHQLQRTVFARFVVFSLVLSFFFSHLSHIWADANLEYDILRQDAVFPLSYPATAKTLLTKYGLFNIDDYIERKNSPLSFTTAIPNYPQLTAQCNPSTMPIHNRSQSVFFILTDQLISATELAQFQQRSAARSYQLKHNIDTSFTHNAWFNLLYSLPSIYQKDILAQGIAPLLFQGIKQQGLSSSFTLISDADSTTGQAEEPQWFEFLFDSKIKINDISSIFFANKLNNIPTGLHVLYFKTGKSTRDVSRYQFELFVDALLLAQKQKQQKDIIWISSLGNQSEQARLSTKPALLVYPSTQSTQQISLGHVSSHMDLQPTLLLNWLGCKQAPKTYSNGADLLTLNKDRVIANTTTQGVMVFNKDKSVFIDQHGNFQSYSRQLQSPITVNVDFPLMIDGVNFIKQFSKQAQVVE